jgi:hypothetical protein
MLLILACLSLALAACSSDECTDCSIFEGLDPSRGKGDEGGFPSIEAALGETHFDLSVEALPAGVTATKENLVGRLLCLRFHVDAGTPFAATMQQNGDGDLDPYLLLLSSSAKTLASANDQWVLPMGAEADSVLAHTARESDLHFLFACGEDFDSGGSFRIDLVNLNEPPGADLSLTNPTLRAHNRDLREVEGAVATYLEDLVLSDGADGYLYTDPQGYDLLSLEERGQVNQLVEAVNNHRETLFEECLQANDLPTDAEPIAQVGRACAQIWKHVRSAQ